MVAKIKSGKSLIGALNYNENKVKKQKAVLIAAVKYFKEAKDLSFSDKLLRLTDMAAMNTRAKTNAVHISLNFPNGENLNDEKLGMIAGDYMLGIGFGQQPFLVYRHEDAGHPHIHIVTTNIKRDGQRINLHYLGQNESERTRKAIEISYGLAKAGDQQKQREVIKMQPRVAEYGKAETKRAITNILDYTIRTYKFTSVPELNAVLGQFNIMADRGAKDSRMFAHDGLVYWMLNSKGKKTGVPIKASSIYGKPTLKALGEKFRLNEGLRKPFKAALIGKIDQTLKRPQTADSFIKEMSKLNINVILRRNNDGRIYGVTFLDQQNKVVFNGSDLGKAYSANLLSAHFLPDSAGVKEKFSTQAMDEPILRHAPPANGETMLGALFEAEYQDLAALKRFKKKKRKGLKQ
ncbi:relaxase/mobilization nuclease domain-containing protein [Mucilaginibacter myungsuensis]|uniref:Relaxase/mobilization nuclease domain-containing protein n=1 Tax=Mucilaginibacter myungsuensis TaxID=649104 RepID=A0A929KXW5_9SPHI|nr:relaxase/mobilization nuclease domain-containing protein [Mucilaginibacter myungsuensis]MBE9663192.1 relaxase/mobilization nuclease domain-containing protein [Mucilaginibacter myungsuensis]MDN3598827.1 relaxase/mobilization nuclease domain-containing protein [Mucilaginibacter myungsuensis]